MLRWGLKKKIMAQLLQFYVGIKKIQENVQVTMQKCLKNKWKYRFELHVNWLQICIYNWLQIMMNINK